MVGVFSDGVLHQNSVIQTWPEVERLELVRHCRWVDEVVKDVPWELTTQFLEKRKVDFVAIDEGTTVDPTCDNARVRGYDELKKHGMSIFLLYITTNLTSLPQAKLSKPEGQTVLPLNSGLHLLKICLIARRLPRKLWVINLLGFLVKVLVSVIIRCESTNR